MDAAERENRKRIRQLVWQLGSKEVGKTASAEQELLNSDLDAGELIAAELHSQVFNHRAAVAVVLGYACSYALTCGVLWLFGWHRYIVPAFGSVMGSLTLTLYARSRSRNSAVRILAQLNSPAAVGPLAYASNKTGDADTRRGLARTLERLVPTFAEKDVGSLTAKHRKALHDLLPNAPSPLGHAILDMFVRISDTGAIPAVAQLAGTAVSPVHGHAAESLKALQALAEVEKQRATLLRPPGSEATQDILLRPAGNSHERGQVLLRVARAPGSDRETMGGEESGS